MGGGTFFAVFWEFDHEMLSILPSNMGDLSIHGDVECCLVVLQVPSWDDDDDDDDDDGPHGFLNTVFTVTIPVMSCQSLSIIIWLAVSIFFVFHNIRDNPSH